MADSRRRKRRRPDRRTAPQGRRPPQDRGPSRETERRRKTGKKGRTGPRRRNPLGRELLRLFAMVLVVAVILFCAVLFFKVTDIQVSGSRIYTEGQVIGASGISEGDSLLTISRTTAAARIKVMLPYIENVKVSRFLPGSVVIEVTESGASFSVEDSDGTGWLINASGKVLEQADVGVADYPKLIGVTAKTPRAGRQMVTDEQDNLAVARQLLELLSESGIVSHITEIDVTQSYDIVVWYGNQYEIHLGGSDRLEYKIRYLLSIMDQLDNARGGVIDLTLEEKDVAIFREFEDSTGDTDTGQAVQEPEPEPESELEPGTEPDTVPEQE